MRIGFASYKLSHIAAFAGAFIVHGAIVVSSLLPSNPVVINKQAIQVSFVAPSASNQKSADNSQKELALNSENQNAFYKKQNQQEEAKENSKQKTISGKETSGRVDEKAIATRAAESEPIFDAAYLNNPAPYYPSNAKKRGIQGKVLLEVAVNVDGSASSVAISRSSGHEILDEAALDAVKTWHFVPAKKSGKFVAASVLVPVEFKII